MVMPDLSLAGGDPEATGEATDSRPIGWLREEARDGRRYQALLYQDELPLSQVERTWKWWTNPPRTEAWADRYGGGHPRVEQLLERGRAALKADQLQRTSAKWLVRGAASVVCLLLVVAVAFGFMFYRERSAAQLSFGTTLRLGDRLFALVLNDLNRGDISSAAAKDMVVLAGGAINDLGVQQDVDLKAVLINQLMTMSDIYSYLGDDNEAYRLANVANDSAAQMATADPGNARWQELVYDSDFRIGDALVAPGPQQNVQEGLALYRRTQAIARHLVDLSPDDGARLYDLAFIANKVGETLQQLSTANILQALDQFNAALQIANKIAALPSAQIEWRAYPPSTLTKIGRALAASGQAALGIAKYDEAIRLQKGLLKHSSSNNDIVLSNLILSHRLKGDALALQGKTDPAKFTAAADEYTDAITIARQLVDKDISNAIWLNALAVAYDRYGDLLQSTDKLKEALEQYKNEVDIRQKLANKDKTNAGWQKSWSGAREKADHVTAQLAQASAATVSESSAGAATEPSTATAAEPSTGTVTEAKP